MNEIEFCLTYAKWNRYILIGYSDCLEELLHYKAREIKELTWILSEAVYTQKVRDVILDVYDDYGLAVQMQVVRLPQTYLNADLSCKNPVNILDFTNLTKIPTAGIARGSYWLDMLSLEEKRKRIQMRNLDVLYFSFEEAKNKLELKGNEEGQKSQESLENLDTISKNGYNT